MLDLVIAGAALLFGKNVIKSTLNVVDSTLPSLIQKSAHSVENITDLASNATESLPTFGLSVAASHLMDMEQELNQLNQTHGTNYSSYREIIDKYKKIGEGK